MEDEIYDKIWSAFFKSKKKDKKLEKQLEDMIDEKLAIYGDRLNIHKKVYGDGQIHYIEQVPGTKAVIVSKDYVLYALDTIIKSENKN